MFNCLKYCYAESYCFCKTGYRKIDGQCIKAECMYSYDCDAHERCLDYHCQYDEGYHKLHGVCTKAECNYDSDCTRQNEVCRDSYCKCRDGYQKVRNQCTMGNCIDNYDCRTHEQCHNHSCQCIQHYHKMHDQCINGDCVYHYDCRIQNEICINSFCTCARDGYTKMHGKCVHGDCVNGSDCTAMNSVCNNNRCRCQDGYHIHTAYNGTRCIKNEHISNSSSGTYLAIIIPSALVCVLLLSIWCVKKSKGNKTISADDENGSRGYVNERFDGPPATITYNHTMPLPTAPPPPEETGWFAQVEQPVISNSDLLSESPPRYETLFPEGHQA